MVEEKTLTGRRLERAEALTDAVAAIEAVEPGDNPSLDLVTVRDALVRLVAAVKPKIRSTGPRVPLEKAEPEEVQAYFESTGMSRKQIASAAKVSTSVISTVQNPKGDRWSVATFTAKQVLIDAYVIEHADEIETARLEDIAAAKAKADKAAAKAAKKAAKAAAPATPVKQAPANITKGQHVTAPPKRRKNKAAKQAAAAPKATPTTEVASA